MWVADELNTSKCDPVTTLHENKVRDHEIGLSLIYLGDHIKVDLIYPAPPPFNSSRTHNFQLQMKKFRAYFPTYRSEALFKVNTRNGIPLCCE